MNYGQTRVYGVLLSYIKADGERGFHTMRSPPTANMKQSNMYAVNGIVNICLLLTNQT